ASPADGAAAAVLLVANRIAEDEPGLVTEIEHAHAAGWVKRDLLRVDDGDAELELVPGARASRGEILQTVGSAGHCMLFVVVELDRSVVSHVHVIIALRQSADRGIAAVALVIGDLVAGLQPGIEADEDRVL